MRTTWESYEAKALKIQNNLSRIWGPNNHFWTFILLHYILFYCCQQLRNYCDLCGETGNLHADWIIYAHINCYFASSSSDMWENHIVLHSLHLDLYFIIKNIKISFLASKSLICIVNSIFTSLLQFMWKIIIFHKKSVFSIQLILKSSFHTFLA